MGTDLNMFQIISYYTRYHGYQSKSKLEIDTSDGWVDRPRLSLDFYLLSALNFSHKLIPVGTRH